MWTLLFLFVVAGVDFIMGQTYFSAASELHNTQMQTLFNAYATSFKRPVEDDPGGENIS